MTAEVDFIADYCTRKSIECDAMHSFHAISASIEEKY